MTGTLYFIVGPSGCGKDSLISYARERFTRDDGVLFARRYITRPPDDRAEKHIPLRRDQFYERCERGDFLLSWKAHDLFYAIDKSVLRDLAAGFDVVVNGSRAQVEAVRERVQRVVIVSVGCDASTLKQRLQARGREKPEQIEARLKRASLYPVCEDPNVVCIDNTEKVCVAGDKLCAVLAHRHTAAVV
ncbi:MAG: phosphonate metabolism protein/1,5-bisphosphokinase (PRPP-forming) PhnN [Pseudomonadota bacterium]